ncbi:hypothetical protein BT96DRAFT_988008 [Gymnopus androsaceus JB14]|uniref:Uncharacterized protein n=1 Tax=Gymnopus androsaceus JB14 TaxID=1447944 RepID=A0A6A4IBD5_9AGAR|nr:hypothetical protein BT96DRAFT_988008 [Gymnopus androsaceus JB14]
MGLPGGGIGGMGLPGGHPVPSPRYPRGPGIHGLGGVPLDGGGLRPNNGIPVPVMNSLSQPPSTGPSSPNSNSTNPNPNQNQTLQVHLHTQHLHNPSLQQQQQRTGSPGSAMGTVEFMPFGHGHGPPFSSNGGGRPPFDNNNMVVRSNLTPTSYQSIQIPNLYSSSPSCPTSPSLLPMISRRVMHNGNPEDVMSDFDFMPNNEHLMAPAFGHEQPNLHSSQFLQNMFNMTSNEALLTVSTDTSLLLPAHQIVCQRR